ncbi:endolytic transglycosylase MltG [Streptomyces sp. GC420]|uniref:endolytic transglycosylase MltG n=1 Tax=Streptomyces sp. GC420 TaxID=2697568 RepID=UPI001414DFF3|nr:endolytic transglycosylase MltG [Streptomyces sp. GC420]NBM16515.1 endolytic transglycosylase MltG [Streptomyces sp. GC420]
MTDYGRGPGSEPWHPEDPLYGDQGWRGQQAADGQDPYAGQSQQQYPEQAQAQAQYGDGGQDPYLQQQYQQQYGQQPYDQQQYQQGSYDQQQYQQQYQQQQYQQQYQQGQYDQQQYQQQQQYYGDGGTGAWNGAQAADAGYGNGPGDPYVQQHGAGYGGEQPDHYGTPGAYPPPQPPGTRGRQPDDQGYGRDGGQEEQQDWDSPAEEPEHPFFAGTEDDARSGSRGGRRRPPHDDDDGGEDDEPRSGRRSDREQREDGRGRGGEPRKGRSGMACLIVAVVLVGGVGGVAYYGYQFYQGRFGAAPDFAGSGNGTVTVEIPDDTPLNGIGQILKEKGVVKSVDAFVSAAQDNSKSQSIQAGVYTLRKEMSASAAIELMLDPSSLSNFIVAEGRRNVQVYELIDKRLGLKKGTTADVAKKEADNLGLPDWANDDPDIKDPLEGFLFPAAYSVTEEKKPKDVLKEMVARANKEYSAYDLEAKAEELGLTSPLQVITVASLVQAEGKTHDDYRKMASVIYNRLKPTNTDTNQKLEFDSAFNYLKNQSEINIATSEIRNFDDPYNTYFYRGLPPGPIDNPGKVALEAAMKPDKGAWMYFVSVDGDKTQFAKTLQEHNKLVEEFNARQRSGG